MNVLALINKHGLFPRGVIQAGSHHGEEIPLWESMGIHHCHFEPVSENWRILTEKFPKANAWPAALGRLHNTRAVIHTETVNGGQSCSLLKPKDHLRILPWIKFDGEEEVLVVSLDGLGLKWTEYNFLYLDVQGYELEVLKGAEKTLAGIDFIFTEVNRAEVFEGCGQIGEVDAFLADQGFRRVETEWHGGEFGDALYIR